MRLASVRCAEDKAPPHQPGISELFPVFTYVPFGAGGHDVMFGGKGNDFFEVDSSDDQVYGFPARARMTGCGPRPTTCSTLMSRTRSCRGRPSPAPATQATTCW